MTAKHTVSSRSVLIVPHLHLVNTLYKHKKQTLMSQIYPYAFNWNYQKYICSGIFNNIQVILKAYCNVFITIMITIINFQLKQNIFTALWPVLCI